MSGICHDDDVSTRPSIEPPSSRFEMPDPRDAPDGEDLVAIGAEMGFWWFSPEEEGRVFRRGKHKGTPLADVAREAPDYLQWMLGMDDADEGVLEVVRAALGMEPPAGAESTGDA